jgi:hypothetical protein
MKPATKDTWITGALLGTFGVLRSLLVKKPAGICSGALLTGTSEMEPTIGLEPMTC